MFQAHFEVEENNSEEEVLNNTCGACISLHSLVGGKSYHTMRVVGLLERNICIY